MRGLDELRQIRRRGLKPSGLLRLATETECEAGGSRLVCDEGDRPAATDLRPFVGLSVFITGRDFDVVDAWAQAIANAGATNVAILVAGDQPRMSDAAILKHNGEMLA